MIQLVNFFIALALVGAVEADHAPAIAQPKTEVEQLAEDLELLQGAWEMVEKTDEEAAPHRTALKEVTGKVERITRFDAEGNVTWVHTVDFRLDRGPGPSRVFTFSNVKFLEGRLKGKTSSETTSYLYQVDQENMIEAWGMLTGDKDQPVEINRWTRVNEDEPE